MTQVPGPYDLIRAEMAGDERFSWLPPLLGDGAQLLRHALHGDLPRWLRALDALPAGDQGVSIQEDMPAFGVPVENREGLKSTLMQLHPWRKGPLQLGGLTIDTEWRSDWKWQRIAPHIAIRGHRVLDVGCGNGYYGWRMLERGAKFVVGIDPTLVYAMQWLACLHFAGPSRNAVLPLGIDDLPGEAGGFDTVFSMGVLYHRKDPVAHLARLRELGRPSGQLVLETLILDEPGEELLEPKGRYARMRNVHHIPSPAVLEGWMKEAGFNTVQLLDVSRTTAEEQRTTPWMMFESLAESLDPQDPERTVEGHPAPVRAAFLATIPA